MLCPHGWPDGGTGERGGGNCASVKGLAAWLGRLRSGWPPELPRRQDDRRCRYLHRYVRALVLRTEKKKKEEEEEEDGEESPRAARSFRGMLFSFLSFLSPPPSVFLYPLLFLSFFFFFLPAGGRSQSTMRSGIPYIDRYEGYDRYVCGSDRMQATP